MNGGPMSAEKGKTEHKNVEAEGAKKEKQVWQIY